MKYYKLTVTLKNGFVYSYTCIGRMLEGMKKSSDGYWTEKIEVVEITAEEHWNHHTLIEEKPKKVTKTPTKVPKMASLENFFENEEPTPRKKSRKLG